MISASFVTPYPPGFPVIVPGQLITSEILGLFQQIKVGEIHGFDYERGFKVFKEDYLAGLAPAFFAKDSSLDTTSVIRS